MTDDHDFEVIVVGAGLAGLSAAIAARNEGVSVLLLESAPRALRGGNTAFSGGGLRTPRNGNEDLESLVPDLPEEKRRAYLVMPYSEDEYYRDVMRVTGARADPELVTVLVRQSLATARWLKDQGAKWAPHRRASPRDGRLVLPSDIVMFHGVGNGGGLSSDLFDSVERKGVDVAYETTALKLIVNERGRVRGVTVKGSDGFSDVRCKAVVLATGGFEANREWRTKYLGPGWEFVRPRGSRFNQGGGHKMALEIGAKPAGHWSGCHAVPMDWTTMQTPEGRDVDGHGMSRFEYSLGIEVNARGARFLDEGENWMVFTYAKHGTQVFAQPDQMSWQIFDAKTRDIHARVGRSYSQDPDVTADSLDALADRLRMPALRQTIDEFNAAVQHDRPLDYSILDGRATSRIVPPKSNWATTIDTPPFAAYKVAPGITFTFGGLKINGRAQVLDTSDSAIPGLYAAGNTVGGIWHHNYTAGGALAGAATFGRIAGANAAGD